MKQLATYAGFSAAVQASQPASCTTVQAARLAPLVTRGEMAIAAFKARQWAATKRSKASAKVSSRAWNCSGSPAKDLQRRALRADDPLDVADTVHRPSGGCRTSRGCFLLRRIEGPISVIQPALRKATQGIDQVVAAKTSEWPWRIAVLFEQPFYPVQPLQNCFLARLAIQPDCFHPPSALRASNIKLTRICRGSQSRRRSSSPTRRVQAIEGGAEQPQWVARKASSSRVTACCPNCCPDAAS